MQEQINIITPVYNGEHLIHRLLDSLLIQTYSFVTMYVVDDGSTDKTKSVIEHYIPLFEKKGYKLCYIYQENGGQSAALNRGLKYVNGDYLLWPDADDWYKTPDAIETMVNVIRQTGDDVGIARCQLEFVDEETMEITYTTAFSPCDKPCDLLEDAVYGIHDFLYAPIEWIAKVKFLDTYIRNREIYVNKNAGQNVQILFPYLGYSKCVTIDKTLCCYLVRKKSHSHIQRDYENQITHCEAQLDAYVYTTKNMDVLSEEQKDKYITFRRTYYCNEILNIDYEHANRIGFREHYKKYRLRKIKINKRYCRLWIWTYFASIISYKNIQKLINHLKLV